MKCSESLSNMVSNIIRSYIDYMKFAAYMVFSLTIFLHALLVLFYHCVYGCMFRILLFKFVSYVFLLFVYVHLLLSMFCSVYAVFIVPNGTLRLH
jgi:hypothetical protein